MPVPYGRKSRSKSRMQRSANMRYKASQVVFCEICGHSKLNHLMCDRCQTIGEHKMVN
ncbi:MAG: 50S ribosomal protein L32 [Deltaproteobacteria bacterium]|nr:MAG: 50S ribosomal protein L32 [Deltaproteobacteria bacterium]